MRVEPKNMQIEDHSIVERLLQERRKVQETEAEEVFDFALKGKWQNAELFRMQNANARRGREPAFDGSYQDMTGMVALQSSTIPPVFGITGGPQNAIDGNRDTLFTSG